MTISIHRFAKDNGEEVSSPILSGSISYDEDYILNGENVKLVDLNDSSSWVSSSLSSLHAIKYCVSFFNPHGFSTTDAQKYSCFLKNFISLIQIDTLHGKRDCITVDELPEFQLVKDNSNVTLKIWKKLQNHTNTEMKTVNSHFIQIKYDHWALIPIKEMKFTDFKMKLDLFIQSFTKCNFSLQGASDFNFLPDYKEWEDNNTHNLHSVLKFAATIKSIQPMLLWKTSAVFTALESRPFDEVMEDPYLALAFFRFLRCIVRSPECKINQKIQKFLDYLYDKYGLEIDDDILNEDVNVI